MAYERSAEFADSDKDDEGGEIASDADRRRRLLAGQPNTVQAALRTLGQLLTDSLPEPFGRVTERTSRFVAVAEAELVQETMVCTAVHALSVGAALDALIHEHKARIQPGHRYAPEWRRLRIDNETVSIPSDMLCLFDASTLMPNRTAVVFTGECGSSGDQWELTVIVPRARRADAHRVLDMVDLAARTVHNVFRGRVLQARAGDRGLDFEVLASPADTRDGLVLPPEVWTEIDHALTIVKTGDLARRYGFPPRYGLLLAGPPGVGKTALGRVIAAELLGAFTVIVVDANEARHQLAQIYAETTNFGPTLVLIEDIDLYLTDRAAGRETETLATFLAVMDGTRRHDNVITIATTNDPAMLDKAATRAARFDAIVAIPNPGPSAAVEILRRSFAPLPQHRTLDFRTIAAALPANVSGADLREIARRSLVQHGGNVTTDAVVHVIRSGRWKPGPLAGNYL